MSIEGGWSRCAGRAEFEFLSTSGRRWASSLAFAIMGSA